MKKSSELSTKEKAVAPIVAVVSGIGGFALEVLFGKSVAEGVVTGIATAGIFGTAAYCIPRLEDNSNPSPPVS